MAHPLPLFAAALDSSAYTISRAEPAWLWSLEAGIALTIALMLVAMLAGYLILAWKLRNTFERLGDLAESFRRDLLPVTRRAAEIAEHLEGAAASVHGAVDEVTETIRSANERLRDAVETADARFHDLDAIVRLARDEAEDVVVGAASTLRGVRGGFSAFRGHRRRAAEAPVDGETEDNTPPLPPRRAGGPRIKHEPAQDGE